MESKKNPPGHTTQQASHQLNSPQIPRDKNVVATGMREKGREPNKKKTIPWQITRHAHYLPNGGGGAGFLPVDPDKSPLPVFLNACLIVSIVSSPLSIPKSLVFDLDGELAPDFPLDRKSVV